MAMDHGILNLPLNRRGGDTLFGVTRREFERKQAESDKAARKLSIALMAEAKGLIEMVSDARMAELGKRHAMNAKQCRKMWHSIARGAPGTVVGCMRKELAADLLALTADVEVRT